MRAEKPLCYTLPMTGLDKQAGAEHHGHRERLRERFAKAGLDGFAPHEALELLLTFTIPRQDVNPLAHNHPSGLAQPSRADIELTAALKAILAPLSIALTDHVIIAGEEVFSFAKNGLIR